VHEIINASVAIRKARPVLKRCAREPESPRALEEL
jgi:hypothetical protein